MPEYTVYLKNIGIKQFSRLMESARRASLSIKVSSGARGWKGERKERPYSLAISEGHQGRRIEGEKREKQNLLSLALIKSFTPSSTNGSKMEWCICFRRDDHLQEKIRNIRNTAAFISLFMISRQNIKFYARFFMPRSTMVLWSCEQKRKALIWTPCPGTKTKKLVPWQAMHQKTKK